MQLDWLESLQAGDCVCFGSVNQLGLAVNHFFDFKEELILAEQAAGIFVGLQGNAQHNQLLRLFRFLFKPNCKSPLDIQFKLPFLLLAGYYRAQVKLKGAQWLALLVGVLVPDLSPQTLFNLKQIIHFQGF